MATRLAHVRSTDRRHDADRRRFPGATSDVIASLVARRACLTPDEPAFVDSSTGSPTTWLELARCAESWRQRYPADLRGNRNTLLVGVVAASGAE
ncbi:MAG TPA: hypothetical protein VGP46_01275, partial [Acidimicrobiales bacterium]|nr:hypothetical protein [Acidimicrobiales bacterium]